MKGSIRAIGGLLITMSAAGGMDTATNAQLIPCIIFAAIGLAVMYSGVTALNSSN